MNRGNKGKIVAAIAASILALFCIGFVSFVFLNKGADFVPTTDFLHFVRILDENEGMELDPNLVFDKTGQVKLSEVLSQEKVNRYGADAKSPDGVGLEVTFTIIQKGRETNKIFSIPGWARFQEEGSNGRRRNRVEGLRPRFDTLAREFVAKHSMSFSYLVVLDTTEGGELAVNALRPNFKKILAHVEKGHKVSMSTYLVRDITYLGDHREDVINGPEDVDSVLRWASSQEVKKTSSIYAALKNIFEQREKESLDGVMIATDGMEFNPPIVDFYQIYRKGGLAQKNWAMLDSKFVTNIDLSGIAGVDLLPFPPRDTKTEAQQNTALAYLEHWLTIHGAKEVKIIR